MAHYAFLVLFLVLGSEATHVTTAPGPTTTAANVTTAPGPTTTAPNVTTAPGPTTANVTTAPGPTTTAPNVTTAPGPTTAAANVTTAPGPTTTAPNVTTAPGPTTTAPNVTTAPGPTTAAANVTTAPGPTTAAANVTTAPGPTTAAANVTTTPGPTTAAANVTTAPPPTTAAPSPMPPPPVGNYNVSDVNGTCLMATMGLQIGYKEDEILKSVNLDPDTTEATGKCGSSGTDATLVLAFNKSSIIFTFSEEGGKFRLHAVNATLSLGTNGTIFRAGNANLSLWEASVGNSYMCRRVQAYNITDAFVLRTNGLRVQPYDVQSNRYSTAHECAMDDTSILIPIVVGAALAGLILIVMIAYVIGRRKTYVGYQTL